MGTKLGATLLAMALWLSWPTAHSAGQDVAEIALIAMPKSTVDYAHPALLTGTIYELGSQPAKILFKFKRTAVRSGAVIRVLREFFYPDGTLAAREQVVYQEGQLTSYQVDELQSGAKGLATIRSDANHPDTEEILFEYFPASGTGKKKQSTENVRQATLINDMIAPFMLSRWEDLMRGAAVKFRFIVLPRTETVGFKLVKQNESAWHGKPVVLVKMEPTSPFVARLVAPIIFVVEKGSPHRVFQYVGRTTPQMKVGKTWKDLDGLTVFDWQ